MNVDTIVLHQAFEMQCSEMWILLIRIYDSNNKIMTKIVYVNIVIQPGHI